LSAHDRDSQFKSWLIEYGAIAFKVARSYASTTEDCQDLVQDILLEVWRALPSFQERSRVSTWSYRVALNTALNWRRGERRRQSRHWVIADAVARSVPRPESSRVLADHETVERLYAAVRQLPKPDAALILLYLDGLTYSQMADVLGITESNVGVKLNRAKKSLGRLMKEGTDEP